MTRGPPWTRIRVTAKTLRSIAIAALLLSAAPACIASAPAPSVAAVETNARGAREPTPEAAEGLDAARVATEITRATNAFRKQEGRGELAVNAALATASRDFVEFMARTDRYGHDADGRQPGERAEQNGYDYCIVAENIAYQYRSSGFTTAALADALVEGWKKSPQHRHNMLDPGASDTGAAVAQSRSTGRWYAVQMFGMPKSAQFPFSITNTTETLVRYRLDDRVFELAPRVTRTHKQCRATELVLHDTGAKETLRVTPTNGERYRVVSDGAGGSRLARE
jgi:uncharacterized protein YkwD